MEEFIAELARRDWVLLMDWILSADNVDERAHLAYSHALLNNDRVLFERLLRSFEPDIMCLPNDFSVYANSPLFPAFLDQSGGRSFAGFEESHSMRDPDTFEAAMKCFPKTRSIWRYYIADGISIGGAAVVDALGPNFDLQHLYDYARPPHREPGYSIAEYQKLAEAFACIMDLGIMPRKEDRALVERIIRGNYPRS